MYKPPPLHSRRPIPPTVRWTVMLRAGWHCEECDSLHVELHHLRYHTDEGQPIFGYETAEDLAVLCRDHHHARHIAPDGVFWSDPEEMQKFWAKEE